MSLGFGDDFCGFLASGGGRGRDWVWHWSGRHENFKAAGECTNLFEVHDHRVSFCVLLRCPPHCPHSVNLTK